MTEQAVRAEADDVWSKLDVFDGKVMVYWKEYGIWWLYLPKCGVGNLQNHNVVEHEDGTITVTPSILVTGHDNEVRAQRHGYLTKGVWSEC